MESSLQMDQDDITQTCDSISYDLRQAIDQYELWIPTLEPSDRFGKNSLASSIISDALRQSLIITLCRIWDDAGDSIPKLEKRLKKRVRHDAFERWDYKVAKVRKSNQLCALVQFRNQGIGHRQDPHAKFKKSAGRKSTDDLEQTR
jgi:hypothetical protein